MPTSLLYPVSSLAHPRMDAQGSPEDAFLERSALWDSRYNYQSRGPKTWKDRNHFVSHWPRGGWAGGQALGIDYSVLGTGNAQSNQFEPYSCDGDGNQKKHAIRGTTIDAALAPVADAVVQGFVTATDAFVGEVQSASDGTYTLMTEQLKSTAHYLVAYKPGSPDIAGTTVNTLLPTEVDGT